MIAKWRGAEEKMMEEGKEIFFCIFGKGINLKIKVEVAMDVHDPETRSYNMSRIKGKDTKSELLVRKFLFSKGYRYRLHDKKLPGKPDIILPKYKTIIFVHGCFWHGHEDCSYFKIPDTNSEWWREKIKKTKAGDSENITLLSEAGWKVLVIYECSLKKNIVDDTFHYILSQLSKG